MSDPESKKVGDQTAAGTASGTGESASVKRPVAVGMGAARRNWKELRTKRSSAAVKEGTPQLKTSWEKKQEARRKRERLRELKEELEEKKRARKASEIERQKEKRARQAAALLKSANLQMISNPEKIKRMNKKQLKRVKKIAVDKDGNKVLVSPWAK